MKDLGVKAARKDAGFSQNEMADTLGMGRNSYIDWENGNRESPGRGLGGRQSAHGVRPRAGASCGRYRRREIREHLAEKGHAQGAGCGWRHPACRGLWRR